MRRYAVATEKGEILQITVGPYRYVACNEDVDDATHYLGVGDDLFHLKKALAPNIKVNGLVATVSNLPEGIKVETNGADVTTDNEPLVITYDTPGDYRMKFSGRVEYLTGEEEVTVGDP